MRKSKFESLPVAETALENTNPILEQERKKHTLHRILGVTALLAAGTVIHQNYNAIEVFKGFFNKDSMSIPDIEGCADYRPPETPPDSVYVTSPETTIAKTSELTIPPTTTLSPTPSTQPQPAIPTTEFTATTQGTVPFSTTSSARDFSITDLNPFKTVNQYLSFFDHEFGRHVSAESGIEFRFFQFGKREGLKNFDAEAFSRAFHASLTTPFYDDNPEVMHAVDCMRTFYFDERRAEGLVMPIVVPDRPACIRAGKIVYNKCKSSGYTWPKTSASLFLWDVSQYDEFIIITSGGPIEENSPSEQFNIIAHEGQHKLREIAEGDNYSFELDPEEAWVKYIDKRIQTKTPYDLDWIFGY